MASDFKQYIGDGVYADFNGFHVVLTTENGISVTNEIYLEDVVMAALLDWHERLQEELKK